MTTLLGSSLPLHNQTLAAGTASLSDWVTNFIRALSGFTRGLQLPFGSRVTQNPANSSRPISKPENDTTGGAVSSAAASESPGGGTMNGTLPQAPVDPQEPYTTVLWVLSVTVYAKDGATGVVTHGENATSMINAALAEGGDVYLRGGVYRLTGRLLYTSSTTLRGAGLGRTYLNYTAAAYPYAIAPRSNGTTANIHITDLTLLVTSENVGGVDFRGASFCSVERCNIANNAGGSVEAQRNRIGVRFDGEPSSYFNTVRGCDVEGWYMGVACLDAANVNHVEGGRIRNNYIGFDVETGSSDDLYGVDFEGNTYGIRAGSPRQVIDVYNGYFEYNGVDILSYNAAPGSKINLYGVDTERLTIGVNEPYDRVYVYGFDSGHLSSNRGNATIVGGTTSVVVKHGMGQTPAAADIVVQAMGDPTNPVGSIWVSGADSTQFTISVENDPGENGLDLIWVIDLKP